jgi:hypothetical protein
LRGLLCPVAGTSPLDSHEWPHPAAVYGAHADALPVVVEILDIAVDESMAEARRRDPTLDPIPGTLLATLVRDKAVSIASSPALHTAEHCHAA